MAPFPALADHWHVSTPRRQPEESRRLERSEALTLLRRCLEADFKATRDPRVPVALEGLDAGWTTAAIGRHYYTAYACACPKKG